MRTIDGIGYIEAQSTRERFELRPKRKPTIRMIAEQVGVSPTIVSVVLKDPQTNRASYAKREEILETARELGYRPNMLARNLSGRKTNVVAIITSSTGPVFNDPYLREVLCGLQESLFESGLSMSFVPTRRASSPAAIREQLQGVFGYDGIVFLNSSRSTLEQMELEIKELRATRMPFVIGDALPTHGTVNAVMLDREGNARSLRHLLELGHKRILLLPGLRHSYDADLMLGAYNAVIGEYNLSMDNGLILYTGLSREDARSAIMQALSAGVRFTAVSCFSDTAALGVYEALAQAHLRVPDDVSVVGRHDLFFAPFMDPPLTSLRTNPTELGLQAGRIISTAIEEGSTTIRAEVAAELAVRASTAAPAEAGRQIQGNTDQDNA